MKTKHILLSFTLIVMIFSCGKEDNPVDPNNKPKRYKSAIYSSISTIGNIEYGSNITIAGNTKTLKLDLYFPENDTATHRPLLILLPGGAFSAATDKRAYLVPEAEEIAKFGYVVACINYRTYDGFNFPISNLQLQQLIVHGMQDAKAAVRFFRKDAATSNVYKINPDKIFLAGHSAGAMVALHAVYLDDISKADADFQTIIGANGGLEGASGNDGYSSEVIGVINLAGSLLDKNYIVAADKPLKNIYGSADIVMPFDDGIFDYEITIAPIAVSGSNSLNSRALEVGVPSSTYTISSGDHLSPAISTCTPCLNSMASFMYLLL